MVKAVSNGAVTAESDGVQAVDGDSYFSEPDADQIYLRARDDRRCARGRVVRGSDYGVVLDRAQNTAAAWWYPLPSDRAAPLVGGQIGFWKGVKIDAAADAERGGLLLRLARRLR